MAFNFKNAYNNFFVKPGNKLNQTINNVVGKDVFGELKPIEDERSYQPYSSFPEYSVPEPQAWAAVQDGTEIEFSLNGSKIPVSKNLDTCLRYRPLFHEAADYYANRFRFKYGQCVSDYDTLLHYFKDMYYEGMVPMLQRAYSLLLPFGVFAVNAESFAGKHGETYHQAFSSYCTMAGIQESQNQAAQEIGNLVGNSVQMQGGGFGVKGAAKGFFQAELFNAGMGFLGKIAANQGRMTPEQKQRAYEAFRPDIFYREVYYDYVNVFFTFVQVLAEQGHLPGTTTKISGDVSTILQNLENPMFPANQISAALAQILSGNPFIPKAYAIMKEKLGETEEVKRITDYFMPGGKLF